MTTHREQLLNKLGLDQNQSYSLETLSFLTNTPLKYLREVYKRGIGAHHNNLSSVRLKKDFSKNLDTEKYPENTRLSAEQWGFARVYSFLNGGTTTDSDIAKLLE